MKNFKLIVGDSKEKLKKLPDNFIDSVVTDPPYHLTSIVKRFGKENSAPAKDQDGAFKRQSKGFMGQTWDGGDIAQDVELWKEVLRVLKPGGHLLAFSHSRTYHRMTVAIEDAGFEIRDMIHWTYGSGFPKSQNISKMIDKKLGKEPIKGEIKSNWLNKDGSITNRKLENHDSGNGHSYGFKDAPRDTLPNSDEAKKWEGRINFVLGGKNE